MRVLLLFVGRIKCFSMEGLNFWCAVRVCVCSFLGSELRGREPDHFFFCGRSLFLLFDVCVECEGVSRSPVRE